VKQIDFVTALGRLLRDGSLRDAYATDPVRTAACLGLGSKDIPALLALNLEDLTFQAEVLLRKRFEAVSRLLPQTISAAGACGWPLFLAYARDVWPSGDAPELDDAKQFCGHLATDGNARIAAHERNRVHFATADARFATHIVGDVLLKGRRRRCIQILVRAEGRPWREVLIYLG
jgi:hypothetical protein